ncbi:ferritin-like domain-containing protein [Solimicrobium silvestre]|uniref:Ferritin-like n=1 Tax=Solimicrobium silvestre TaxID=2099400 RepID=A0A2S9H0N7_9BURK|nr:ferritin-like protein [Solimicrobium silvestre]PRC93426.1 Ferritin-like [Solimicrobium silvestre]
MQVLNQKYIQELQKTEQLSDIHRALTYAVQLELATIPPYLTALFSLKNGSNQQIASLLQSIVVEEMLHMTLAANTLIAIGGNPDLLALGMELQYPGPLPLSVDDGLIVSLAAVSPSQVQQVFMAIEKPDSQEILPGETTPAPPPKIPGEFASIGNFYHAILQGLAHLERQGGHCFAKPRLEQQVNVSLWFPGLRAANPSGKVHDLSTATKVLETIMVQGEGMPFRGDFSPVDPTDSSYAHYFKFGEIFHEQRLIRDPFAPSGWSYSGENVPLDSANVYSFLPNAALSDYPKDSGAGVAANQFYGTYQRLLTSLNLVFNGHPEALRAAMGVMYELKLAAQKVVQHPADPLKPEIIAAPPFMLTKTTNLA